jgi:TorA maturation chaperone TorD
MNAVAPETALELDEASLDLLFQLIAATYRSPGESLEEDLASGALAHALAALAAATGRAAPVVSAPDLRVLQAGYVDLFVSSARGIAAAPYVGAAIDGELMGPSAQQLGAAFAAHGIELTDAWRDLPDHIAAVAEGGSLLVRNDRADSARELLAEFVAPWFERSTAAIAARDETGFYGPVSKFLDGAIKEVTRDVRS